VVTWIKMDLSRHPKVSRAAIDTNGTLATRSLAELLPAEAVLLDLAALLRVDPAALAIAESATSDIRSLVAQPPVEAVVSDSPTIARNADLSETTVIL
jgi:hypothetical protein